MYTFRYIDITIIPFGVKFLCNSSNINPFYPQEYNNIPIHQIMLPLNPHVSPVWMVFSDCTSLKQPYCPISSNEIPSNPFIFSSVSHYQIYVSHQEKSIVNRKFLAYDMKNRENTTKYQWHNIFVHVPIILLVIYHDISHHIPTNNARHYCWWLHHHLVVVGPPLSQFYRYTSLYILLVTPKEISTELSPSHQSSVGLVPRKAWIWKLWVNFHKHGVKSLFYLLDYINSLHTVIYI